MSFSLNGGLLAMEEIDNGENMGEVEAAEVAATVADESAEIQESNTDVGIEVAKVKMPCKPVKSSKLWVIWLLTRWKTEKVCRKSPLKPCRSLWNPS